MIRLYALVYGVPASVMFIITQVPPTSVTFIVRAIDDYRLALGTGRINVHWDELRRDPRRFLPTVVENVEHYLAVRLREEWWEDHHGAS